MPPPLITSAMPHARFTFPNPIPIVVGSFGDISSLASASPETLAGECDVAEIRLDLFHREFAQAGQGLWQHLLPFPLLFTARCHSEGSPFDLGFAERGSLISAAMDDAALIDIEALSSSGMAGLIGEIRAQGIPWIASFHDFNQLPSNQKLVTHAEIAREAGADAFKVAARLGTVDDIASLARFQMTDHGIPLAAMGMGDLAPVSRLLCAQAGSVLNYGYIGKTPTAPGQWSARQLRAAIRSLKPIH